MDCWFFCCMNLHGTGCFGVWFMLSSFLPSRGAPRLRLDLYTLPAFNLVLCGYPMKLIPALAVSTQQ
jgi:hypothetical protein